MTEVSSAEKVGVDFSGAERRGEVGAMVYDNRTLKLLWCHRRATGLLGLVGAGLDHVHVGSCSSEEDEDEWPELEGLIRLWPRDVCSAIRESCSPADAVLYNWIFRPCENLISCRKSVSGHVARVCDRCT